MIEYIVIWGISAIVAAIAAALLAGWKNRNYSVWMGWCFLFPPLLVALLFMPTRKGPRPRQPTLDELDQSDRRFWSE